MTPAKRKYLILITLTAAIIIVDQLTKHLIVSNFRLHETWTVISGLFEINYIQNTGAAFGIFQNADATFRIPFFVAVPLLALAAIAYVFRKIPETDFRTMTALSLVVGGALGNLIDRLTFGFVVDFLDFHWNQHHFPAFNVADTVICVGVGLLMLDLLGQEHGEADKKESVNASTPL